MTPPVAEAEAPALTEATPPSAGRGWDLLLLCLSGFILTSVARIHQLFPLLAVIRPVTLLGTLAIALCLVDRLPRHRISALKMPATRYLLALVVWMALSVPGALWQGGALATWLDFLKTALIYLVMVTAVRTLRDVERLALIYLLGAVIFAIMVLMRTRFQVPLAGRTERLHYYYDSNDFATYTVTALPLGLYFAATGRPLRRYVAYASIAVLAAGFVWSGSRGGFLALLAVVAYFLLRYTTIRRSWRWTAVVTIGVIVMAIAGDNYWARISTVLHPTADYNMTSNEGRLQIWQRGFGYMVQHPLLGVGAGNFPRAEGTISPLVDRVSRGKGVKWEPPHNSYLQVGAELGVPGLLLFLAFLVSVFRALRALPVTTGPPLSSGRDTLDRARLGQSLTASIIGFAVGSFFLTLAYHDMLYILAGMAVGLRHIGLNAVLRQRYRMALNPAAFGLRRQSA